MTVDAPEPAAEDRAACQDLLDVLPDSVADQPGRTVEPDSASGAAWGDPPIVLTCGGPPAAGFTRTSSCTTVNGVDWFIAEDQLDDPSPERVTITTVYRRPTVSVRLPGEYWPPATTLADLADAVRRTTRAHGSCV